MRHATIRLFLLSALCGVTATACASTPPPAAQADAARPVFDILAWSDEFDAIDPDSWTFETGGHGWGNNERQFYTDGANAFTQYDTMAGSRVLVIEARRGGTPAGARCWYGACEFSSTRMITRGKQEFRYGRIEARIRLPHTQGIWPAFWMLGSDFGEVGWPRSGEIDVMEHVGYEATLTHGALHGPGYTGERHFSGTHDLGEPADAHYHVYAVEWTPEDIRWFVDGSPYFSLTRAQVEARGTWVFDQPFFLLLNVAVGGDWPGRPNAGSVFPQRMYVDWVRVYHSAPPRQRRNGSQPLRPAGASAAATSSERATSSAASRSGAGPAPGTESAGRSGADAVPAATPVESSRHVRIVSPVQALWQRWRELVDAQRDSDAR